MEFGSIVARKVFLLLNILNGRMVGKDHENRGLMLYLTYGMP